MPRIRFPRKPSREGKERGLGGDNAFVIKTNCAVSQHREYSAPAQPKLWKFKHRIQQWRSKPTQCLLEHFSALYRRPPAAVATFSKDDPSLLEDSAGTGEPFLNLRHHPFRPKYRSIAVLRIFLRIRCITSSDADEESSGRRSS